MKTEPVLILIENIDILLEEPEQLKTPQNLLAKLLKVDEKEQEKIKKAKEKKSKKKKDDESVEYGLIEKVIDGISLQIECVTARIRTLGVNNKKYFICRLFFLTPRDTPDLVIQLKDLKAYTTNEDFKVMPSLRDCRAINRKRDDVHVFKEITTFVSLSLGPISILKELGLKIHVLINCRFLPIF